MNNLEETLIAPVVGLSEMTVKDLWRHRDLLRYLVKRDMQMAYATSRRPVLWRRCQKRFLTNHLPGDVLRELAVNQRQSMPQFLARFCSSQFAFLIGAHTSRFGNVPLVQMQYT